MTHLHQSPFVSVIRAYDQPGGYEERAPYKAVVTVTHLTDAEVYLSVGMGVLDAETWLALLAMLKAQGIKTVGYERHGAIKKKSL